MRYNRNAAEAIYDHAQHPDCRTPRSAGRATLIAALRTAKLILPASGVIERAARARARRRGMDALNERTARFPPGIDTALDVISGAESGVLCGLHRHCGAFAVGAVEQQDLARDRGEHTQHTAR